MNDKDIKEMEEGKKALGYFFLVVVGFGVVGLLRYGSEIESDLNFFLGWASMIGMGHVAMKDWLKWY